MGKEKSRSGIIGILEEYWKRKREEMETETSAEREEDLFRNSKKMLRSPEGKEMASKNISQTEEEERTEKEKNLKEMIIGMMNEMRERFIEQGKEIKKEMEEIKNEYKEQWRMWMEERKELKKEIEVMKKRIEVLEEKKTRDEEPEKELEVEIIRKMMEKLKEEGERERRKNNIIIKRVEENEKDPKEVVKELWGLMEVDAKIEEIKEIGRGGGRGGGRIIKVKLEEKEDKIEIMRRKKALKGRKEKIQDDWTWKERTMQYNLEEIALEKRKKGNVARVKYGRIWKEGRWWRWNNDEEKLMEGEFGEGREEDTSSKRKKIRDRRGRTEGRGGK